MSNKQTLRGFATISYWADDMEDPIGNVLEIMHNPHYLEVLNS